MADLDIEEPVSDSSFVILGHGSLPPHTDEESNRASNVNITTNNKSTLSGFESSNASINGFLGGSIFSEESIQKKLNELVKENYELKETLSQNNLAIKSQLDTFFMWQQEVLRTHQTHKQKFLETKDLILKLRAENSSLKKQLENSVVTVSSVNDESYSQVNKRPERFEETKVQEKSYNDLIKENEMLNDKIQKIGEELKAAKIEILQLSNELENLGRDNAYLKQRSGDFNKNSLNNMTYRSLPNSEARAQISNLLRQLDEEKSKVQKLKEDLKKIKFNNTELSCTKLSTTEELNQYIGNLNDMNVSIDMQNQRFSSLQSWVSLAEETLKENKTHAAVECNLICEINELKTHLNQEENVSREKQEIVQELRNKFTMLLNDYKALQLKLNAINSRDTNIEKYKEEISSLSVKLEAKDNELKLKHQEYTNLKEENEKLKCKKVDLLRSEVEVYQCDFNGEQETKKNKAEEFQQVQRKIVALEKDNQKEKNDSGITFDSRTCQLDPHKIRYTCPHCMFTLVDQAVFVQHIQECSCNDLYS